jgi:hypothetical protein
MGTAGRREGEDHSEYREEATGGSRNICFRSAKQGTVYCYTPVIETAVLSLWVHILPLSVAVLHRVES